MEPILHLLAFSLPLVVSAFLATGPHDGPAALAWIAFPAAMVLADHLAPPARRNPPASPRWLADAQLYALTALQVANLVAFAVSIAHHGAFGWHGAVATVLVGLNSGYSGIVVAHELVHRPPKHLRFLGRVLMTGVLYEHFTTEHVRGHHVRVGTPEDGATARFGEPFWVYLRRSIPQQFRSAWALESRRGLLRNRVLHGVVASLAVCATLGAVAGLPALVAFVGQAAIAVLLLEAVNWFEHWGLVREGPRPTTVDSWDAESWVTLYTLVGLSQHADHHANAARPYPQLRAVPESPKLPSGYLVLALSTLVADGWIRERLAQELGRTGRAATAPRAGRALPTARA